MRSLSLNEEMMGSCILMIPSLCDTSLPNGVSSSIVFGLLSKANLLSLSKKASETRRRSILYSKEGSAPNRLAHEYLVFDDETILLRRYLFSRDREESISMHP